MKNVDFYFNISSKKFIELLCACKICWLPLNTQSSAGLIVLLQAGLLKKPVISTSNFVMRSYIQNDFDGILHRIGDVNDAIKCLDYLIKKYESKSKFFSENLYSKILNHHSPSAFASGLFKIYKNL